MAPGPCSAFAYKGRDEPAGCPGTPPRPGITRIDRKPMRLLLSLLFLLFSASVSHGQGYLSHAAEHGYYLMAPLTSFNGAVFGSSVAWSQPAAPGSSDPDFGAYLDAARGLRGELQTRLAAVRTARDTTLVAAFRAFHGSLSAAIEADAGAGVPARERFRAFRAIVQPTEERLASANRAFSERFAERFADHACVRAAALLRAVDAGTVAPGESFRGHVLTQAPAGTRPEWVAVVTGGLPEMNRVDTELSACTTSGMRWARRGVSERDGTTRIAGFDLDPAGLSAPTVREGPTGAHVRLETRTAADGTETRLVRFRGAIR